MQSSTEKHAVVSCNHLTKTYDGGVTALKDLTLRIEEGMSFGLLGENGAGKSTLVRLIMGFILPSQGELFVLGERKVNLAHPRIGYLHERPYVELRFTGRKYLAYMAQLSGLWDRQNQLRVSEVLELVGLSEAGDERLNSYSKGMLQRLCLAQTLLTDPAFLILDEPTSGLDPYSQWQVRQIINELRQRGKTLLICSHYLAEIETICNQVGILQRGQLIRQGAVKDLIQARESVEILLGKEQNASEIVQRLSLQEYVIETEQSLLTIHAQNQQQVLLALVQAEIPIQTLHPVSRTLEDVYIQVTRQAAAGTPEGGKALATLSTYASGREN